MTRTVFVLVDTRGLEGDPIAVYASRTDAEKDRDVLVSDERWSQVRAVPFIEASQ